MMLLWIIRFFVFHLYESPKYLMGKGRDQEAVDVVHIIARYNGVHSSLTIDELKSVEAVGRTATGEEKQEGNRTMSGIQQQWSRFASSNHVYPLFATRKLAYSTSLLIVLWGKWKVYF